MKLLVVVLMSVGFLGCSKSKFVSYQEEKGCTVQKVGNVSSITCDGETVDVIDGAEGDSGQDGINGVDGQDSLIVDVIDPCGAETSHDEVLLVLNNGDILAYFAGNSTTRSRLTILKENVVYITTDDSSCKFKIINDQLVEL